MDDQQRAETRAWFVENNWKTNKMEMQPRGKPHVIEGWEWFSSDRDVETVFTTPGFWAEEPPVTEEMYEYMNQQMLEVETTAKARTSARGKGAQAAQTGDPAATA